VSVSSTSAQANAESFGALAITPDGRYVAFHSLASNLVPNDPDGNFDDVFLRDRVAGTTRRIPDSDFVFDIELSRDARIVAYDSFDGWISVYNRRTGRTTTPNLGDLGVDGAGLNGMSADGRLLLFTGSTNDSGVLASVVDRQTGRLEVISRARFGGFPDADSYARPSARTACTRYSSRQPTTSSQTTRTA
jgi:hypothetical protein